MSFSDKSSSVVRRRRCCRFIFLIFSLVGFFENVDYKIGVGRAAERCPQKFKVLVKVLFSDNNSDVFLNGID